MPSFYVAQWCTIPAPLSQLPRQGRRMAIDNQATKIQRDVLAVLNEHYRSFHAAKPFADRTGHTVPSDTKSFSEVLVSLLTGLPGRRRRKGSDLADGSDVKAANLWDAIDTPRFNGCAPAGRTTSASRKPNDVTALDDIPFLLFVLWDERVGLAVPRSRVVRETQH